ncbi:MAG: hypothetical protein CL666_10965 [Balneola sp.]|nr:hypothetical protein [Balneola sp.]|tara:strand:+ start:29355 stop:29705 length:351 start_codon:yes stop_codon:yes gene_type:complete
MKSIISTILFTLVLTTGLFAQQNITNEKHERLLTHVEGNIFNVQFLNNDGNVVQEGQYWRDADHFKPHGTWLLYSEISEEVVTKATYEKGKQLTVETNINGKVIKADRQHLASIRQ